MNAALFYENKDPRTYVSMVPTSAISGDGMGDLIALIVDLSQKMLAQRLSYSDELQCHVMEVWHIQYFNYMYIIMGYLSGIKGLICA
jgi:translation initiation factor 5B